MNLLREEEIVEIIHRLKTQQKFLALLTEICQSQQLQMDNFNQKIDTLLQQKRQEQ